MQVRGVLFAYKNKLLLIVGAVVLVVIATIAGVFLYRSFAGTANNDAATVDRIVKDIGTIYELPNDEQPSIAQLQDLAPLAQQEFYKNAQKGDYVLVYQKAQLALIYRESSKKLVNVDHVEIGTKP